VRRRADFRATNLHKIRSVTEGHGANKFSRTHRREPMSQVDEDSVSEQGTTSDGRGGEERTPDRETGEGRRVCPLHLPSSYLLT
jgi:hypothetical protein